MALQHSEKIASERLSTSTVSTLKCVYKDSEGNNVTHSFNYADSEVTANDVKGLMNATITNGSILKKVPTTKVSAEVVTTEKESININS